MGAVPTLTAPQVAPEALPGVRQSSPVSMATFGNADQSLAQAGEGIDTLANHVARIGQRQDADAALQAEANIKDAWRDWSTSAQQRSGTNAWGVSKDANDWWTKNAQQYADGLQNDRQREIFNKRIMPARDSGLDTFAGFEAQQRRASVEASGQASIVSSINLAAANPMNKGLIDDTRADIDKTVLTLAQLNGWSPDVTAVKRNDYTTQLHKQVLQGLYDTNPQAAKNYYDVYKAEIDGSDHAEIEKNLDLGGLRQFAQHTADDYMSQGLPESQALAQARKDYEGKQQDQLVQELKTRYSEKQQQTEQYQKQQSDVAWKIFAKNQRVSDIPVNVFNSLDGRVQLALKNDEQNAREGTQVKTDPSTYYNLRDMLRDKPDDFAKLDLRQYFSALSPSDRKDLYNMQDRVQKGDDLKDVTTLDQQKAQYHNALKFGKGDEQKKYQFDRAFDDAVRVAQQEKGSALNDTERQKIGDKLITENAGSGFLGFGTTKFYNTYGADNMQSAITTRFQKRYGRLPTAAELKQIRDAAMAAP